MMRSVVSLADLVGWLRQRSNEEQRTAEHATRQKDTTYHGGQAAAFRVAAEHLETALAEASGPELQTILVEEGWWHPNVKSGQVHDHSMKQPQTMHRLCVPVYTKRGSGG